MNIEDIIFRGRTEDRGWLYGDLSHFDNGGVWINERDQEYFCEVDPNTVGQYTGMKDKDGTKIFEGDVISRDDNLYRVVWNVGAFGLLPPEGISRCIFALPYWVSEESKVIGNIHDNDELRFVVFCIKNE